MATVYASIGNSDDKLSQSSWAAFLASFRTTMREHATQVYGDWVSHPDSEYQNACMAIATWELPLLRADLIELRKHFHQESIALVVCEGTEFI